MSFGARLDRWILATTITSTLMFAIASEQVALGLVAVGLIVAGFSASRGRSARTQRAKAVGERRFVMFLNALTLGMVGYAVVRVSGDRELLVTSVGDMLVWSLVIRVFDPRSGRRRGLLLLMSIFGALSAVLTSNAMLVGLLLIVYVPTATWTVMLHQFAKGHEAAYSGGAAGRETPALLVPREALRRLRSISLRIAPAVAAIAFLVYLIMPRGVGADMLGRWEQTSDGATTGFTDQVLLQRSGVLTGSEETVMDVVVTDARGANIGSSDQPVLLRGAVLDHYDPVSHAWLRRQMWSHTPTYGSATTRTLISRVRGRLPLTTYRITLRNKDTDYLFAPMRPAWILLDRDTQLDIGTRDLVLRAHQREGRMTYTIEAAPEWSNTSASEGPLPPIEVAPRVIERAREIIGRAGLARDPEAALTDDDVRIARIIESEFRRRGVYSTQLTPSPPGVDPIEHFVVERMRGHCEQFASAMAAMLRGLGVSARVVTGFRAHEFNDIAGHYTVRQNDAHAWVEVRTAPGVWQSFDPSPAEVDGVGLGGARGVLGQLRQMYEAVEHLWVVYVVSFDEQMKRALLERLGIDLRESEERLGENNGRTWRPGGRGPRVLRAVGAGLIAFAATAAALYAAGFLARLMGLRVRLPGLRAPWTIRLPRRARSAAAMERRFARAMNALARAGLERPHGRGALAHGLAVRRADEGLGDAVLALSRMHYATRFGAHAPSAADLGRAEALASEIEQRAKQHARTRRTRGSVQPERRS